MNKKRLQRQKNSNLIPSHSDFVLQICQIRICHTITAKLIQLGHVINAKFCTKFKGVYYDCVLFCLCLFCYALLDYLLFIAVHC